MLQIFLLVPSTSQLNISILNIGPNFISLIWNDISDYENNGNVLGYILNYRINGTQPFEQIYGIKGFSYTLTSLMPFSLYEISIIAKNSFGIGPPSSSLFVKTLFQGSTNSSYIYLSYSKRNFHSHHHLSSV